MTNITSYLQNGQYYYRQTNQGASGSSGSYNSSGYSASGSYGPSGSYSYSASGASGVLLGTVDRLSVTQVTDLFTTGNLTVNEIKKWCSSKGVGCSVSTSGNFQVVSFTYSNKQYTIKCNKTAASSQTDSTQVTTFTASELKNTHKLNDSIIAQYFDVVEVTNNVYASGASGASGSYGASGYYGASGSSGAGSTNVKYVLKANCGYSNIDSLKSGLFTQYKNDLIMDNFLKGNNLRTSAGKTTETANNLYKTRNNTVLSQANFAQYAGEIGLATGTKKTQLQQDALNKLVQQFAEGNLAKDQVQTILNAIGVTNYSSTTSGNNYKVSFKFNSKSYSITCNKDMAASGFDNKKTSLYTADDLKNKHGLSQETINKYFEAAVIENGVTTKYAIKAGNTIESVKAEKFTKTSGQVNGIIDEIVGQGASKDCWSLAGLLAVNDLRDFITKNDDGSYTVTFKGLTTNEVPMFTPTDENGEPIRNLCKEQTWGAPVNIRSNEEYKKFVSQCEEALSDPQKNIASYRIADLGNGKYQAYYTLYEQPIQFVSDKGLADYCHSNGYSYDKNNAKFEVIDGKTLYYVEVGRQVNGKIKNPEKWYLASLNQTYKPLEGSYTITESNYVSYTISAATLSTYDTDNVINDAYSNGDNDALLMEIALDYLAYDLRNQNILNLNFENSGDFENKFLNTVSSTNESGYVQQLFYYLYGEKPHTTIASDFNIGISKNDIESNLHSVDKNHPASFTLYSGVHVANDINGKEYRVNIESGHSFAITNVNNSSKQVTFVDPHDSSIKITMTFDEFTKLGIGMLTVANTGLDGTPNYSATYSEADINYIINNGNVDKNTLMASLEKIDGVYVFKDGSSDGALSEMLGVSQEVKDWTESDILTAGYIKTWYNGSEEVMNFFEKIEGTDHLYRPRKDITSEDLKIISECGYATDLELYIHKLCTKGDSGTSMSDYIEELCGGRVDYNQELLVPLEKLSLFENSTREYKNECGYYTQVTTTYNIPRDVYGQPKVDENGYCKIVSNCNVHALQKAGKYPDVTYVDYLNMDEPNGVGYIIEQLGKVVEEYEAAGRYSNLTTLETMRDNYYKLRQRQEEQRVAQVASETLKGTKTPYSYLTFIRDQEYITDNTDVNKYLKNICQSNQPINANNSADIYVRIYQYKANANLSDYQCSLIDDLMKLIENKNFTEANKFLKGTFSEKVLAEQEKYDSVYNKIFSNNSLDGRKKALKELYPMKNEIFDKIFNELTQSDGVFTENTLREFQSIYRFYDILQNSFGQNEIKTANFDKLFDTFFMAYNMSEDSNKFINELTNLLKNNKLSIADFIKSGSTLDSYLKENQTSDFALSLYAAMGAYNSQEKLNTAIETDKIELENAVKEISNNIITQFPRYDYTDNELFTIIDTQLSNYKLADLSKEYAQSSIYTVFNELKEADYSDDQSLRSEKSDNTNPSSGNTNPSTNDTTVDPKKKAEEEAKNDYEYVINIAKKMAEENKGKEVHIEYPWHNHIYSIDINTKGEVAVCVLSELQEIVVEKKRGGGLHVYSGGSLTNSIETVNNDDQEYNDNGNSNSLQSFQDYLAGRARDRAIDYGAVRAGNFMANSAMTEASMMRAMANQQMAMSVKIPNEGYLRHSHNLNNKRAINALNDMAKAERMAAQSANNLRNAAAAAESRGASMLRGCTRLGGSITGLIAVKTIADDLHDGNYWGAAECLAETILTKNPYGAAAVFIYEYGKLSWEMRDAHCDVPQSERWKGYDEQFYREMQQFEQEAQEWCKNKMQQQ